MCFPAVSQRLCSPGEDWSSIINSLVSVERSRAAGSRELRGLARQAKESIEGKVALSALVM